VATIAVDPPQPPTNPPKRASMKWLATTSAPKWLAEQEVRKAAQNGAPVIIAMPTTPVGPWDWKPTPTGKIIVDFLNGKMPVTSHGPEFVGVGRMCRRPSTGFRKRQSR